MSEPIKPNCGNCVHFVGRFGERRGECYFFPPVTFSSGVQLRPKVLSSESPCGQHKPLPEGEKAAIKEKVRPNR